jgi:hypothetical protein
MDDLNEVRALLRGLEILIEKYPDLDDEFQSIFQTELIRLRKNQGKIYRGE